MALGRLYRSNRRVQRGAGTSMSFFQTTTGKEEHPNEQRGFFAPAPADQIGTSTPANSIQRKCAECEKEEKEQIQRKETNTTGSTTAPSVVSSVLSSGGGRPLDASTRKYMENRFGEDFGHVRIHTDDLAAESASAIQARAYTSGQDVVFGKGEYKPESTEGKHLLAHELAHVGQQKQTIPKSIQRTIGDGEDLTSARFAGIPKLEAAFDGERNIKRGDTGNHVIAIQQALIDDLTYDAAGDPLPKFMIDGVFGKETKAAVIQYQKKYKLKGEITEVDGIVGPETMKHLDRRFGGSAGETSKKHTVEEYITLWEAKTGRKMTDEERRNLARGCIGVTVINLGGGGLPNPPENLCYSTFKKARETADNMNSFMQSQGITDKRARIYSIRFWSDGKDYKPDTNGKVDLSGWAATSRPNCMEEIGTDCINFDYGFYDPVTNMWWHANHCEQIKDAAGNVLNPNCDFVDEKMEIYESTLGHYSRPLYDFDKQVFCVGVSDLK